MLQASSVKMRRGLLRYMIERFDTSSKKFVIEKSEYGSISLDHRDVTIILGLVNTGLSVADVLIEEGLDIRDRIPSRFVSRQTHNLVTDQLIEDTVRDGARDDDFLRRSVLVLIGVLLAPDNGLIVPKEYFALVEDIKRMRLFNWNAFTLSILFDGLGKVKNGDSIIQRPRGNLALIQVQADYFSFRIYLHFHVTTAYVTLIMHTIPILGEA
ncbi:hypothetical protein BRADI_1g48666v3 [Brachypodium distachyon]|uniref:Aminotransferase-like plant mobile domain-containing protein n=1 Tax=Brachypodium distachyon TaxID=15368 RepID=A0A0Q3L8P0_BRADI|nr:hypothetical protein BRADI_1g48666v3 [Brachypodium distachyon]